MKCMLMSRIIFIWLILTSIDFIYSGSCCCRKNENSGGSKTNLTSSRGSGSKPVDPTKGLNPLVNPEVKPEVEGNSETKNNEIAVAITNVLNNRTGTNRVNIIDNFVVVESGDKFTIKYGRFTGSIKIGDVDINNITNSKLTIDEISRLDGNIIIFNRDKCKLGDFVAALGLLQVVSRNENNEEYLAVEDVNGLCISFDGLDNSGNGVYINLNNGLVYKCDKKGYIGRGNNNINNDKYSRRFTPFYRENNYYALGNVDGEYVHWASKKSGDPKVIFVKPILKNETLNNFIFKIRTV